jgi:poly(A) polymerase/tRNA nucleotidyltransferase (CCA-adding enzyme)
MNSLEVLKKVAKRHNLELYFAGGYVRDLLRKRKPRDYDLVVRNVTLQELAAILTPYGRTEEVGAHYGILLFWGQNPLPIEIAIPRKYRKFGRGDAVLDYNVYGSLKEDSNHRDFTINSMYLPLLGKRGEIIDYHKGQSDIKNRVIRAVKSANQRIKEDPVRMLRAFSLASRLNYTIDSSFLKAIKTNAKLIQTSAPERVRGEIIEIVMCRKPSKYLRMMEDAGLLRYIFPFLSRNVNVKQDRRYHKYDVFTHSIRACDSAPLDITLRLAALLHDIGKYSTKEVREDRISFHNHEVVGEIMARDMLTKLLFPKSIVTDVAFLIRKHMYNFNREWTPKAVRKFIRAVGITREDLENLDSIPLFLLRQADRLGNGFKRNPVTEKQRDFQKKIAKIYRESTALTVHDLAVKGGDLINSLGLAEGPQIGHILKYLLELVLDNPKLNNKETLLKLAKENLDGKN